MYLFDFEIKLILNNMKISEITINVYCIGIVNILFSQLINIILIYCYKYNKWFFFILFLLFIFYIILNTIFFSFRVN